MSIRPLARPGDLLKQHQPRRKKLDMGRAPRERDAEHLDALRQMPCIGCGAEHRTEAAHIRFSSAKDGKTNPGVGQKPHDRDCLPLCGDCHREQHAGSELGFWAGVGVDPVKAAVALYSASPNVEQMRAIVLTIRATTILNEAKASRSQPGEK